MDREKAENRPPLWHLVHERAALKREERALHGTAAKIWAEGDLLLIERGAKERLRLTVNFGKKSIPLAKGILCTNARGALGQDMFMIERKEGEHD